MAYNPFQCSSYQPLVAGIVVFNEARELQNSKESPSEIRINWALHKIKNIIWRHERAVASGQTMQVLPRLPSFHVTFFYLPSCRIQIYFYFLFHS